MRIAINARFLVGQPLEGVGRYTLECTRQLMRLLPEAEFLLLTDRRGPLPEFPRAYERQTLSPPARHPVLHYLWFEWAVPRALRRWRAEVFVTLDNYASLRTAVPTVLAIHDLALWHYTDGVAPLVLRYYHYYMPRFARRADRLVAVSEATRADLSRQFGIAAAEIAVVPNGVRPRFGRLSPKQIARVRDYYTDGEPYFVAVGSVHPRKNIDGLIRAFDRFCESATAPHHLVIVGRMAWSTGPVREALAASPNGHRILPTDFVDDETLGGLIGAADALALVSHFEGFGVPIVEAFACGVPVVVSDTSSLPEVAGPGGLTVDPNDPDDIAAALTRLATDPALRQVLAEAGRRHAEQYTWERAGEALRDVILSL